MKILQTQCLCAVSWLSAGLPITSSVSLYGLLVAAIWSFQEVAYPTLGSPFLIGLLLATCAAWFVMQPGMGLGVAARKTPDPLRMRLRTIVNHAVFSFGLYVSAIALHCYLA